jgi:hypothetical protein
MKAVRYFILMFILIFNQTTKAQNQTTAVSQVLEAYLGVEKALVNDNSSMANDRAVTLVNAIEQVNAIRLTPELKTVWAKNLVKLRYNSKYIKESKDIDEQRGYFASLSDAVYALVKSSKSAHPTVYREYCPMKKQYWLNPTAAIQNPYYGKQMLDCGKVTETIAGSASVVLIK